MLKTTVFQTWKGMNRLSDRLNMPAEYAWDIQNAYIRKDKSGLGVITQRLGVTKFHQNQFSNPCKYIYEAQWSTGVKDIIIREGTRWAIYDLGTDTFDDLDTGRTDGARGQAVMFGNQLIMTDGGIPRKCTNLYTVSDLCTDGAMPIDSTAVHVHQHKVWLNSTSNPMTAYYSKSDSANASDSFSASSDAGTLDFRFILPSGDRLIGFKTFAETLLVFVFTKYIAIYNCGSDPTEFAIQQIIPVNCMSAHAIRQVGNDLAFASLEGVNSLKSSLTNQSLDIDDMTKLISPMYRDLISGLSDKTEISMEFSHDLNHLYIGLPLSTQHQILVYSIEVGNVVGRWQGYKCNSFCERQDGTMLVGGDNYVYIMNSGTSDDGTAIEFSYEFPYLYFGSADYNKAPRQFEGLVKHERDLDLNFRYWFETTGSPASQVTKVLTLTAQSAMYRVALYRTSYYRSTGNTKFQTSDILGRGKQMALSISHNTLNATIEIPYFIIRVAIEGRKIR